MTTSRRIFAALLALALVVPPVSVGETQPTAGTRAVQPSATASAPSAAPAVSDESAAAAPQRSRAARRSYARETRAHRRHHRISKGEVAMMGAVAGTSLSIGALAGGGTGLAIGAIVGGWGAYAVHRLWRHLH